MRAAPGCMPNSQAMTWTSTAGAVGVAPQGDTSISGVDVIGADGSRFNLGEGVSWVNTMLANQTALGRVGLPDDIGSVVAFLCTDDAKWVNAQRIEVSGGIHI